jgi:hypothetical protein
MELAEAQRPNIRSVLEALTRERLYDIGRITGIALRAAQDNQRRDNKRQLVDLLSAALGETRLSEVLRELGRDELRQVCRSHGLPDEGSRRSELATRLRAAAGVGEPEAVHLAGHGAAQPAFRHLVTSYANPVLNWASLMRLAILCSFYTQDAVRTIDGDTMDPHAARATATGRLSWASHQTPGLPPHRAFSPSLAGGMTGVTA